MHALNRTFFYFFFFLLLPAFTFASQGGYESAEHADMGNNVKLFFSEDDTGQTNYLLHLENGLTVSYGDILTFGDLYGIVDKPISQGNSDVERQQRFLEAFNTFAQNPDVIPEATKLIEIIHNEQKILFDGLNNGESENSIYERLGGETNRQLNCATGGGCSSTDWLLIPGRYVNLQKSDNDHFGDDAWTSYQAGHTLAIQTAILAHQTHDKQKLEIAYAMNAFACHFLSDHFAAGHIRTPRTILPAEVSPSLVGAILTSYMHAEENDLGLHVHNRQGSHWIAYGDKHYYAEENKENRNILTLALQISANQIFSAYMTGEIQNDINVYALLPVADENGNAANLDLSALFYWDDTTHKLMRRKDIANFFDRHWTADWWGWSTLVMLSKQRGMPLGAQAKLALSSERQRAIQAGLITDKNLLEAIKQKKIK